MDDVCRHPSRLDVSNLPQGDAADGLSRRSEVEILDVAYLHLFCLLVTQHDRHFVIALPDGCNLCLPSLQGELQFRHGASDAKLRCCDGIERNVNDGRRLVIVGVNPLQLGHLAHPFHETLCSKLDAGQVIAIETILVSRHRQVVHLLETNVSSWPEVAQARCILV